MPTSNLTKNYNPRIKYYKNLGICHKDNLPYVESLARYFMSRIKLTAKPYSEKHRGVKDNGSVGKKINVTIGELMEIIIESNGKCAISGKPIHFPIGMGILSNPKKAISLGLLTQEENQRFPSMDRIKSSIKHYDKYNLQLTTKECNLGKSNSDVSCINHTAVSIEKSGVSFRIENCTASYLKALLF